MMKQVMTQKAGADMLVMIDNNSHNQSFGVTSNTGMRSNGKIIIIDRCAQVNM